ncbi:MAG: aldehyde dehydrogenase family protein, partial [Cyclobacteriaceae bacterium]
MTDTMENTTLLFNKSFVNGLWVAGSEKMFNVLDPATGEIISSIFDGGIEVTSQAIDAAHSAFKDWRKITPMSRSVLLERLHNLIMENQDLLAEIMTRECGKPLKESVGEVRYASSFLKWFAEEGKRSYGDVIPASSEKNRILVTKEPIGVVAAITPWNFPMAMITRKIGAALAAGCTVVIRPSEETPLTALALAYLAKTAGFPPGVINVVVGNDPAAMGKVLCESNLVMKISFTGSTRVGRILMSQSSQTLKKLSLELGGNAPF